MTEWLESMKVIVNNNAPSKLLGNYAYNRNASEGTSAWSSVSQKEQKAEERVHMIWVGDGPGYVHGILAR